MADRDFMDVMQDAVSAIFDPGPQISRMGVQGVAELASALFSGSNGYVAYGDGQSVDSPTVDVGSPVQEAPTVEAPVQEVQAVAPPQQEYGGMEM